MKYKGIVSERKPWVKLAFALLAGFMLFLELKRGQYIYVPIVILVILACFFRKEHIISEEGVDIKSILFGISRHNLWRWDEITSLHTDYKKSAPNVMLHIGKDIVTRSFVMKASDIQAVLTLADEMNPNIYIDDVSEEEQERREQEILHRQEVLKAQKATAKRKKK